MVDFLSEFSMAIQNVLDEMDIEVDHFATRFVQSVMKAPNNGKDDRNEIDYFDVTNAGYVASMAHLDIDVLLNPKLEPAKYKLIKKWAYSVMKSNYFAFFRESDRGMETSKMIQRLNHVTNMMLTILYEVRLCNTCLILFIHLFIYLLLSSSTELL